MRKPLPANFFAIWKRYSMRTHEPLTSTEKQQLEAALQHCAGEPIRRPGLIQPHGVLLALAASDLRVCYASQNLTDLFSIKAEAALGLPFAHLVGEHQAERLRNIKTASANGAMRRSPPSISSTMDAQPDSIAGCRAMATSGWWNSTPCRPASTTCSITCSSRSAMPCGGSMRSPTCRSTLTGWWSRCGC